MMVVVADVAHQCTAQVLGASEFAQVEQLRFHRRKEALHGGIVQAVALA